MDWDDLKDKVLGWFFVIAGGAIGIGIILLIVATSNIFAERSRQPESVSYTVFCREGDHMYIAISTDMPVVNGAWLTYTDSETNTKSFVSGTCAAVRSE